MLNIHENVDQFVSVYRNRSLWSAWYLTFFAQPTINSTNRHIAVFFFFFFQDESSVQSLIEACITDDDKLYLCVSSPTIKDKPVQIRPWRLSDADFVLDASMPLDPRKTVFVGGVPRPLKAGMHFLNVFFFFQFSSTKK